MSAVNEWFGYYNAVFTHIKRTYGEKEFELYLEHIAKVAYCDIIDSYKAGGLQEICNHYVTNFQKDGDENSVKAELTDQSLAMQVHCPAFYNCPPEGHPDRKVGSFFCQCCQKLNRNIMDHSGYNLQVTLESPGDCIWNFSPK